MDSGIVSLNSVSSPSEIFNIYNGWKQQIKLLGLGFVSKVTLQTPRYRDSIGEYTTLSKLILRARQVQWNTPESLW